ncbi:hypothetical protein B0H11DRAFT_1932750 [Mycena galericulata]|nr:hypothetical protein B0H11DRAFT_1932750 [Mycena galericulata]
MAPSHSRLYADTEGHIQDRNDLGHFWDRHKYGGHWWGPDARSTWVHEFGVPLGTPDPPFVPNADRRNRPPLPPGGYQPEPERGRSRQRRSASPPYASSSNTGSTQGFYVYGPSRPPRSRQWQDSSSDNWSSAPSTRRSSPSRASPRRYPDPRGRSPSPTSSRAASRAYSPPPRTWIERTPRERRRATPMGPPGARRSHKTDDEDTRRLRERAMASRKRSPPRRGRSEATRWTRTYFPPNVKTAPRDDAGHPICPLEVNEGDADDFGSDSEHTALPDNWKTVETLRQADAIELKKQGRRYPPFVPPAADLVGAWHELSLNTVDETVNLLRWVSRTEHSAYQFMRREFLRLTSDPTLARTPGEVYLIEKQNVVYQRYWKRSTGFHKAPRSVAAVPMALDDDRAVYLGTAMLGTDETIVIVTERTDGEAHSGTHTALAAAAARYDTMESRMWPLGFRINEDLYPTAKFSRVYWNDVAAWYTLNALMPRRIRVGSSIYRANFLSLVIRLLSVAGMYNRVAQMGEYVLDTLPLEHYPFLTMNMGFSHVVAWLIQHGIARDGEEIPVLESFARSRRNRIHGRSTPSMTEFDSGEPPHNAQDVQMMTANDIIHWRDLTHAALQPGIQSTYQHPVGARMEEDTPDDTNGSGDQHFDSDVTWGN